MNKKNNNNVEVNDSSSAPWEDFPGIWKNKTAYFTWLRGNLRRIWNSSPQKTEFMKKHRFQIKNPNPKGKKDKVWGGTCYFCQQDFIISKLQVDHIISAGSLRDWSDVEPFVRRLLGSGEGELRFVCKPCHNVHTYAERHDISFEQAAIEKEVIRFAKDFTTDEQKVKLRGLGASENDVSNAEKRKQFYRNHLMENGEKL